MSQQVNLMKLKYADQRLRIEYMPKKDEYRWVIKIVAT
jgi:hypothetical protein